MSHRPLPALLIALLPGIAAAPARAQEVQPGAQEVQGTETSTTTSEAQPPPEPDGGPYQIFVLADRPPRAASDWTLELGVSRTAPQAGGSGAELLRRAPGFFISQHSGEGKAHQIFLRGFDAVHGQDTEITAGGIPVNEVSNIHAQGYADLHFVIAEAVRELRVVEGAYDPRQGDFAVAGSLAFDLGLTRRGLLARFTAGQHGLVRTMLAWGPEDQPEATFVAAELARGDGFGPSRAWSRAGAIGQVQLPLSPSLSLRLLVTSYAARFDSAGVLREDDLTSGGYGRFDTHDPRQGGSSARHSALFEVTHRSDGTSGAASGYAILRDLRLRNNFTGFLLSPEGDRTEQTNSAITTGGQAHYYRRLLGRTLTAEVGVSFRHDRVEQSQYRVRFVDGSPQVSDPGGSPSAGQLQDDVAAELGITHLGIYGDLTLRPASWISLRAGLRGDSLAFDIYDLRANDGLGARREAFGAHLAPKAAIQVRPGGDLQLFASYGVGYRSPPGLSLQQGERSTFTTVHSGELGGRWLPGGGLEVSGAGFYTYVAEDLVFDHVSGRTVYFGPTSRTGAAALIEVRPLPELHLAFSGTYARAVNEETGKLVPFVPPLVLRLDADAHHPVGELFGSEVTLFCDGAVSALGPRPLPFSETGEGVFLIDLGGGIEIGPAALSIEVFNLLDTAWKDGQFVYASSFEAGATPSLVPAQHFTAGRPFSAQATLTVSL